ncbi:MAG: AsmA family protein, partial [Nitrospira sp.]|nr:AsmA family protein [Nitrospira sp.]
MKLVKILAAAGLVFLIMLTGAVAAVRFFLPTDEIRRQLEHTLSEQLQGTVRIAALEWSPLSGIRLNGIEIERDGSRLVRLDRLSLRYHLLSLLRGTLTINELALTQAEVLLDLVRFSAPSKAEPIPHQGEPIILPTLPISIGIESIRIERSLVHVVGHHDLRLTLHDVNLTARLQAGPKTAALSGILDVAGVETLLNRQERRLPLHLAFALSIDVLAERLTLERLDIRSDPLVRLSAVGQIDRFLSDRQMTLSVKESSLDLERLLSLVQPFLSSSLADLRMTGTIASVITITGAPTNEGFNGTIDLDVTGSGIHVAVPSLGLALEPSSFQVRTGEIPVRANLPGAVHAELSLTTTAIAAGAASLRDLTLGVTADRSESGNVAAHVTAKGLLSTSFHQAGPSFSKPLTLDIVASADETTLSFSHIKAEASLGDVVSFAANGAVGPLGEAGKERPFSIEAGATSDIAKLLSALPPSLLQGFELASRDGPQTASLKAAGALDSEWRPLRANAEMSLAASGLYATSTERELEGTVDRLGFALQTAYRAKGGSLKGTVEGVVQLKHLR